MSKTSQYVDLIGKQIDVENPSMGTRWRGKAIAYADKPTLLVELSDGSRLMLPAEWASEEPQEPTVSAAISLVTQHADTLIHGNLAAAAIEYERRLDNGAHYTITVRAVPEVQA